MTTLAQAATVADVTEAMRSETVAGLRHFLATRGVSVRQKTRRPALERLVLLVQVGRRADYLDVSEALADGFTLDELFPSDVRSAEAFANRNGCAWPPRDEGDFDRAYYVDDKEEF